MCSLLIVKEIKLKELILKGDKHVKGHLVEEMVHQRKLQERENVKLKHPLIFNSSHRYEICFVFCHFVLMICQTIVCPNSLNYLYDFHCEMYQEDSMANLNTPGFTDMLNLIKVLNESLFIDLFFAFIFICFIVKCIRKIA